MKTSIRLAVVLVSAVVLLAYSTSFYAKPNPPGQALTVDVIVDFNTFSFVDLDGNGGPGPGEPFDVEGDIFEEGNNILIGRFLCRGFFIVPQADGDFTFVHQSYEIDGRGTIHVEGNEPGFVQGIDGQRRAIVGATGDFPSRNGEAEIEGSAGQFRITFTFDK